METVTFGMYGTFELYENDMLDFKDILYAGNATRTKALTMLDVLTKIEFWDRVALLDGDRINVFNYKYFDSKTDKVLFEKLIFKFTKVCRIVGTRFLISESLAQYVAMELSEDYKEQVFGAFDFEDCLELF